MGAAGKSKHTERHLRKQKKITAKNAQKEKKEKENNQYKTRGGEGSCPLHMGWFIIRGGSTGAVRAYSVRVLGGFAGEGGGCASCFVLFEGRPNSNRN